MEEWEHVRDNLYQNDRSGILIQFPQGWKIVDGDGKSLIKQAVGPHRGAVNISAFRPQDTGPLQLDDPTLRRLGEEAEKLLTAQLAGEAQDRNIGDIGGQRYAYLKMKVIHRDGLSKVPMVFQECITVKHGIVYVVAGCCAEANAGEIDPLIKTAFASFSIKD